MGFPDGSEVKKSACQYRRHKRWGFTPWVRKIPLRRKWQPIPVFLPGKSHGYTEDSKDTNALPYWRTKEPEIKLPTSAGSSKNQQSFRKTCALLTMPKPLTVWIMTNCGKFLKRWEHHTIWPASWETCTQVKKLQLEWDMEQQTGSKLGKEYVKAVYHHPAYLTYSLHAAVHGVESWTQLSDWTELK